MLMEEFRVLSEAISYDTEELLERPHDVVLQGQASQLLAKLRHVEQELQEENQNRVVALLKTQDLIREFVRTRDELRDRLGFRRSRTRRSGEFGQPRSPTSRVKRRTE